MSQLSEAVVRRKDELIKKLLHLGVYKKDGHHLYELTLSEVETEYDNVRKRRALYKNEQS